MLAPKEESKENNEENDVDDDKKKRIITSVGWVKEDKKCEAERRTSESNIRDWVSVVG